jgi:hypothetical protein
MRRLPRGCQSSAVGVHATVLRRKTVFTRLLTTFTGINEPDNLFFFLFDDMISGNGGPPEGFAGPTPLTRS